MKKIIIASTHMNAGKTSIIVGLAKAGRLRTGYLKPLGDRLIYQKKRQWDYDSSALSNLIGIQENPEDITIGFEQSKLRYMYDEKGIQEKLAKTIQEMEDREILFIEGSRDLTCGISVNLDPFSLACHTGAKLFVVASGNEDEIFDEMTMLKNYLEKSEIDFGGVIINKVHNEAEFKSIHLSNVQDIGPRIIGVIPYIKELTYFSVNLLVDKLFAKVIAGENNLDRLIKHVLVGAMSANAAINLPGFKTEAKLVITSGDRSDMILAALESNTSAVLLTNNIIPPANIISKATEAGTPLLLIRYDTFEAAKQVDNLEPLITKDDLQKADLLETLIRDHLDLETILG
jgi:BioD-like phosphotransacetylase family protein